LILRLTRLVCLAAFSGLLATAALGADQHNDALDNWPQWRGPLATGVAPHGNPPTEWSETKNIKWKVEIPGRGSASPIVWGDRIYILTAIKTDRTAEEDPGTAAQRGASPIRLVATEQPVQLAQREDRAEESERDRESARDGQGDRPRDGDRRGRGGFGRGGFGRGGFGGQKPTNFHEFVVLCIDRNTGKTIWQRTASEAIPHEGHHQTGSFASASPITDGKQLYVSFGSRGLYCFDLDGNPQWDKDLGDMSMRMGFGEGSSPALFGDTLVLSWDHEDGSFIVALDTKTGNEKWRKPREEVSTWATPLIVSDGERTQVIASGEKRVRSYDLKNGDLIWECGGLGSNPIACPVVFEGLAIAMSGHRDPAGIAVPLDARGDVTDSDKIAWRIENTPYIASPVLYDGLLYFTKGREAILSSVEAKTGKVVIDQERLQDLSTLYSSPVAAAGRIYISSREGNTVVLKHGREFEVLATNKLDEQAIDATPAIVGNELILRGQSHLYCITEQSAQ
jgi:outer membrane protein assembly factor BamB